MLFLSQVQQWHRRVMSQPFMTSCLDWRYLIGAAMLIALAAMINFEVRQNQWQYWQDHRDVFFADESPLVSTTDAGYFLSYAENYSRGVMGQDFDQSRLFPDNAEVSTDRHLRDLPLLSVIIAHLADWFYDGDLLTAGNVMLPITGLLTAAMIGVMFWAAGYPAEGAIAATGMGLSTTYLVRSSIGRIDTDQLLVFFLALCLSLILLAARQKRLFLIIAMAVLTGLAMQMFFWWYLKSPFVVFLPLMMGAAVWAHQFDAKRALLAMAIVIVVINPIFFAATLWPFMMDVFNYLSGANTQADLTAGTESVLSFPNTFSTITELSNLDFLETLSLMTTHPYLGVVGAVGFLLFVLARPAKGMIFLPFFVMGMLAFIAGRRFAFFAAPFVWFGAAWLVLSATRLVATFFSRPSSPSFSMAADGSVLVVAGALILGTASTSMLNYMPRPSFDRPTVETFSAMRDLDQNKTGVIATWWDYGYMAHLKSGMATLHDGGGQKSPRTHLFARGLVSPQPAELTQITKFIIKEGDEGIDNHAVNLDSLNQAILNAQMPDRPLYLVVTQQMQGWMNTIATLGLHDVVSGIAPSPEFLRGYQYNPLECQAAQDQKLQCNLGLLDLQHGTLNGQPILHALVELRDGFQTAQKVINPNGQFVLMLVNNQGQKTKLALAPLPLWNSNFNALFHRAAYDQQRLELVLDRYPAARVYRVLQ